jgi:hypothetical protein
VKAVVLALALGGIIGLAFDPPVHAVRSIECDAAARYYGRGEYAMKLAHPEEACEFWRTGLGMCPSNGALRKAAGAICKTRELRAIERAKDCAELSGALAYETPADDTRAAYDQKSKELHCGDQAALERSMRLCRAAFAAANGGSPSLFKDVVALCKGTQMEAQARARLDAAGH